MKRFSLLALLFACCTGASAMDHYRYYTGTIGTLNVEMTLRTSDTSNLLGGFYHYIGKRGMLEISGSVDRNGAFTMDEFPVDVQSETKTKSGSFSGKIISNQSLDGTWKSPDGKKTFDVHLKAAAGRNGVDLDELSMKSDTVLVGSKKDTLLEISSSVLALRIVNADKSVSDKINRQIFSSLSTTDFSQDTTARVTEFPHFERLAIDNVYNESTFAPDELESRSSLGWWFDSGAQLVWNGSGVLCVSTGNDVFSGGAHPNGFVGYACYNLSTGDTISLNEIFIPGYKKALKQAVVKHYGSEITQWGDPMTFNNNFYVTPAGIGFFYNSYEIASYADGPTDLFIPWSELNQWINPNGPMSWVRK